MRNLKTKRYLAILLVACLLGCDSSDSDAVPSTFAVATGGPAGLYYPFGGGMASVWSKHIAGVNAKAEVTGGSVTNVIQVGRRESELGIAMADVVTAAYRGEGKFPEPIPLRVLFAAYPNIVHILTLQENGIATVADLKGRRVSLGAAGSGTAVAAENVITGLGLSLSDIAATYLSFAETTSALKDGTIDAGFVVGGLGLAAVTELAVTRNLRLVPLSPEDISTLHTKFPTYSGYDIPAGTYDKVDLDTPALGIWSAVFVHEEFPEAIAFQLTCTIYKHRDELLKVSQVARALTLENATKLATVPLHPGAEAFLNAPSKECDQLPGGPS